MENYEPYTYDKIKKIIVNYTVVIFSFIIIFIFILLISYYLTPNNYELINWEENKFKLKNIFELKIKPHTVLIMNNPLIKEEYVVFSEQTNLIIKNFFKSQNILIEKDIQMIKQKYDSQIIISNSTDLNKKILVKIYLPI